MGQILHEQEIQARSRFFANRERLGGTSASSDNAVVSFFFFFFVCSLASLIITNATNVHMFAFSLSRDESSDLILPSSFRFAFNSVRLESLKMKRKRTKWKGKKKHEGKKIK